MGKLNNCILSTRKVNSPPKYQIYYNAARYGNWKGVSYDEFELIGQGTAKQYCQKWIRYFCDNSKFHPHNHDYVHTELKTCKVSNCPKCFESWVNRQANRSTRRLEKFLENPNRQYKFRHIVLSPDPEKAKSLTYKELKKHLDFALKISEIKTAIVVFHPFRFDDSKMNPYVSPHFHLLVYGMIQNSTQFYNKMARTKMNWTIKNIGKMDESINLFSTMRYLLSHCGVKKRAHSVRYLGGISYRKLKVEKEPKFLFCPFCELPLTIGKQVLTPKHNPPPLYEMKNGKKLGFVGLVKPGIFEALEFDEEMKIPFYDLVDESYPLSVVEEMIYSFEEKLQVKIKLSKRTNLKYELSLLTHPTAKTSQKITQFV